MSAAPSARGGRKRENALPAHLDRRSPAQAAEHADRVARLKSYTEYFGFLVPGAWCGTVAKDVEEFSGAAL
jgi:hypothetical protein